MIIQTFRVLLVEDELVTAKITERILTRRSSGRYAVTHRATLEASLFALRNDVPTIERLLQVAVEYF